MSKFELPFFIDYEWQYRPLIRKRLPCRNRSSSWNCVQELRRVFDAFDANGDGLICKTDMARLMSRLSSCGLQPSMSEGDLDLLVSAIDEDGDGCIDFGEFSSVFQELKGDEQEMNEQEKDKELLEAFRMFDRNGDGFITAQELQRTLCALGLEQGRRLPSCQRMIQRVDVDGDGLVNFDEFKFMMLGFLMNIRA